ncbi:MAG: dihydrodipicolinate synthase family protein [Cellulomonas sp.]
MPDVRLAGVCPVVETPFDAQEAVDVPAFERLLVHLAATGVSSMMFPGFASEFHKLSDAEVDTLVTSFVRVLAQFDVAAVVSVPTHATTLAVAAAKRAVALGAVAINVLPPYFLEPSSRDVRCHVGAIADAVAPTTVIVQYAPNQTGTSLAANALSSLADRHPNLEIVKVESTPPESFIAELAALERPLRSFVGYAGVSLPESFRAGAIGVQPGCSFTELYVSVWDAYASGDLAAGDALHARMRPYLTDWMDGVEHILAVEKDISARRALIPAAVVRKPGWELTTQDHERITAFLTEFADELERTPA